MVSALDPLGMPVATDVVPGQRADDPLDIPAITRVREGLGRRGLLYGGECKRGALETRAFLQAGGDDYLCPLSETQLPPAVLTDYLAPVWTAEQALSLIHRAQPGGTSKLIAEGFERVEPVTAAVAGQPYSWLERRLVIRSCPLSLPEAVLAYRHEYLVERAMGRLTGRPLSLTPMYLERDDHATGLIRLLSIGLRVLTLLEFSVRQRLARAKTALEGLYVGNPKRATAHPTAERLLEAFQGLTLTIIREGRRRRRHLTPLSRVQQRILALLDFPVTIYTRLCPDSHKPP